MGDKLIYLEIYKYLCPTKPMTSILEFGISLA